MKELNEKEVKILSKFFKHDFVVANDKSNEDGPYKYLIDDFKKAKELLRSNPNYKCFTLVDAEDEEAWILKDWHVVNRIGYFITLDDIDFKEDIRYW